MLAKSAFGSRQASHRKSACPRRLLVYTSTSFHRPVIECPTSAASVHENATAKSTSVVQLCNRQLSGRRRAYLLCEHQDRLKYGDVGLCSAHSAWVFLWRGRSLLGHGTSSLSPKNQSFYSLSTIRCLQGTLGGPADPVTDPPVLACSPVGNQLWCSYSATVTPFDTRLGHPYR